MPGRSRGDDRDDGGDARPALRRADDPRASARAGRRSPRAGTAQRFGRQLQRTREYVAVVRMALARERLEFAGETLELPLPDGPGKALKLTIAPVQERIPVYLAAIGPEEHDAGRRDRRRLDPDAVLARARGRVPAAARGGLRARRRRQGPRRLRHRAARSTCSSPTTARPRATRCGPTSRSTSAAWARASRTSTTRWCGATASRTPPREVQDLYLEGARTRRRPRCPAELIDTVTLCGPADVVRERLAVYRDAGVGTLIVSPMAWTFEDRLAQLRHVAELAALRVLLGAFGDPGHAFPMLALGTGAGRARPRRPLRDLEALAGARRGGRDAVRRRAGVPGLPHALDEAAEALRGGGAGGARDRASWCASSRPTWRSRTS